MSHILAMNHSLASEDFEVLDKIPSTLCIEFHAVLIIFYLIPLQLHLEHDICENNEYGKVGAKSY